MNDLRVNPTCTIDASGHLCPVPILMTEEKMSELQAGEVLEVIFTDPGAVPDLEAWCRASGEELLGFRRDGARRRAYIRKGSER